MAEGKGIPIILHGKENKFQVTFKLEEIVCNVEQSVENKLKLLTTENVNSVTDEKKKVLKNPCKSIDSFENHVGKLNVICSRRGIRSPDYNVYVTENGEFIIQCKMFDNSVTQGRSKNKKDAKHKAAEAMLQVLNKREETRCQESKIRECAENVSIPIVKVAENLNVKLSSSLEPFTNHVGKLNEICFKKFQKHPSYTCCGFDNNEFIMECKIFDNTVTRGQSKLKKYAKQAAAVAMLLVLNHNQESQNKQEESQNKQEESTCSNHVGFIKPAKYLTENVSIRLSSPAGSFENHVGIMKKISSTIQEKQSSDIACETENFEFIDGCKIFDNRREQPKFEIDAVESMLDILNDNEDSRNDKKESQCQKYVEIIKRAKNLTNSTLNVRENISVKLSSLVEQNENHIGKLNKTYESKRHLSYQVQETKNIELVTKYTNMEQPKFEKVEKPRTAQVLLGALNNSEKWKYNREELRKDTEESMKDGEESANQKYMQLIKRAENLYNATANLTENRSNRLSARTETANETYYKIKKYFSNRDCGTNHSEESKIFENVVMQEQPKFKEDAKPKTTEAMLARLNDSEKLKTDGEAPRYKDMQLLKQAKNISNSTLNVTGNENFRLTSDQFENHIKTKKATNYKNKKKHLSHRVCEKFNSEETRYQKHVKFIRHAKNLTNSTLSATENISEQLRSPIKQFENHNEKLNETCSKSKTRFLRRACRDKNGKFAAESNIFKDIVTQEQPKIKKDVEPNASKVLVDLSNNSDASRNEKEKLVLQKHMEFYRYAKKFPISSLNVRKNGRFELNPRAETVDNYVKKLNAIYGKRHKQHPLYRVGGTKNGEFIIECIINNTITRGQSRCKTEAEQKAAKEMFKILEESEKIKKQRSMEIREKNKMSKSQRKPFVRLDTNILVERNYVPAALPSKTTIFATNTSRVPFINYVGKLNEICFKETLRHPSYTTYKADNDEFVIKCEMSDKTCSHGRSTTKKEAKQKAAKTMIQIISKNMKKYQRQQNTKSSQIENFSKSSLNVTENNNFCHQADMPSSSTDENDNLLESSIISFENYVGKLNEICNESISKGPIYTEQVSENGEFTCECKVISNTDETVTWGRSMRRKDAKQKAAQAMVKILIENSKLEHLKLMKSVTIIDTTKCSQQKQMEELNKQIEVSSDWSSLKYMNEEELKMELNNLNVSYTITAVKKTSNALRLKTKRSEDYRSLTFIETGENRLKISLNLLRKAVFGLRILKK